MKGKNHPTALHNKARICAGAIILSAVIIKKNFVIAAGTVVNQYSDRVSQCG